MTRSGRLRRLRNLRRIEEQNQASLLESARAELRQIEEALEQARSRRQTGRVLVERSIESGETRDRVIGIEEVACANRVLKVLIRRKHPAEELVERTRAQYLGKRTERCQVESLLRVELERESVAAQRRSQSSLDEWYRMLGSGATRERMEDDLSADRAKTSGKNG